MVIKSVSPKFNPITHVLFDMDGLLLNTEYLNEKVFKDVISKFGGEYTWDVKVKIMGRNHHYCAKYLIDTYDIPLSPEDLWDEIFLNLQKIYDHIELLPGAEKLIRHLSKHQIPFALATSSSKEDVAAKVVNFADLFSLFEFRTTGCDKAIKNGKPAPDIYLLAASRFKSPPASMQNVLVFEDSVNGVLAGMRSEAQVVMVPDQRVGSTERKIATQTLDLLTLFKPELFALPPYP